ncbi:hypothetical protein ON010_g18728 [Phytophthora cinnamomi]|nr:hypothetical protein ON010_g18728 [Phytophthora cinnamomi]
MTSGQQLSGSLLPYSVRLQRIFNGGNAEQSGDNSSDRERPRLIGVNGDGENAREGGATNGLSWLRPSPSGGPCAMEILVTWLQHNHNKLNRAIEQRQGKKVLRELVREIKASGHPKVTISTARSMMYKLQLQVKRRQLSAFYSPYKARLRTIFRREKASTHRASRNNVVRDEESASDSEAPDLVAVSEDEDAQLGRDDMHASERNNSSNVSTGDTTTEPARTERACVKSEPLGTRHAPINLGEDDDQDLEHRLHSQVRRQHSRPSSPGEVALIASILRERHDLRERGVPQEEIDAYLPLP